MIFGARPIFNTRGVSLVPKFFKFLRSFKTVLQLYMLSDSFGWNTYLQEQPHLLLLSRSAGVHTRHKDLGEIVVIFFRRDW
jgi:hypothetical protein